MAGIVVEAPGFQPTDLDHRLPPTAEAKGLRRFLLCPLLLCGLRRLFLAQFQHEESLAEVQSLAMEPAEVLHRGAPSAINVTKGLTAWEFEGKLPGPPPLLPTIAAD
jgi:hypothetical protein